MYFKAEYSRYWYICTELTGVLFLFQTLHVVFGLKKFSISGV